MRLWPKSLLGQVLLTVLLALLVAQAISGVLLYRAAENRRETATLNAAAIRFLVAEAGPTRPGQRRAERRSRQLEGRGPRAMRVERTMDAPLLDGEVRDSDAEQQLRSILMEQGFAIGKLHVTERKAKADRFVLSRPRLAARLQNPRWRDRSLLVAGLQKPGESSWTVARVPKPLGRPQALPTIALQTLVIFVVLAGLLYLLLRRITRPIAALTARTERFTQMQDAADPLAPSGPDDVHRLIAAHNLMEARITAMLDEKDVMLGAIGHDLKTPLAALRVRIESVEDEGERSRMAASIEDITQSLDEILALARIGRMDSPPEKVELSALAAAVVEEFEDMGRPVSLGNTTRIALPVHVTWLRRALRNLIGNAVRYGERAQVSLLREADKIIYRVDDDGPGIPENRIAAMLEPFTRGEGSRNRATGGAGLGLTLARAIAEQHGGELILANRSSGGLRAEIRLPMP